jgi:hypothetical protein
MYGNGAEQLPTSAELRTTTGNRKLDALLGELSDGEDEGSEASFRPVPSAVSQTPSVSLLDPADPSKPWQDDFHAYLNSKDHLGDLTVTQWWGINAPRYPVWASLARDFLSIMATSVSSERAFSSAGITISKRRNRLKADIVEALQCLKCMFKRGLLFHEDPSIMTELEDDLDSPQKADGGTGEPWDALVEDLDAEDEGRDSGDDDEIFVQMLDIF